MSDTTSDTADLTSKVALQLTKEMEKHEASQNLIETMANSDRADDVAAQVQKVTGSLSIQTSPFTGAAQSFLEKQDELAKMTDAYGRMLGASSFLDVSGISKITEIGKTFAALHMVPDAQILAVSKSLTDQLAPIASLTAFAQAQNFGINAVSVQFNADIEKWRRIAEMPSIHLLSIEKQIADMMAPLKTHLATTDSLLSKISLSVSNPALNSFITSTRETAEYAKQFVAVTENPDRLWAASRELAIASAATSESEPVEAGTPSHQNESIPAPISPPAVIRNAGMTNEAEVLDQFRPAVDYLVASLNQAEFVLRITADLRDAKTELSQIKNDVAKAKNWDWRQWTLAAIAAVALIVATLSWLCPLGSH